MNSLVSLRFTPAVVFIVGGSRFVLKTVYSDGEIETTIRPKGLDDERCGEHIPCSV